MLLANTVITGFTWTALRNEFGQFDKDVCSLCRSLDGMTIKVGDPIYEEFQPGLHVRCRCQWTARTEPVEKTWVTPDEELLQKYAGLMVGGLLLMPEMEIPIDRVREISNEEFLRIQKDILTSVMAETGLGVFIFVNRQDGRFMVNGKVYGDKDGTVTIDDREILRLKGKVDTILHGHPNGSSFMPDDIVLARVVSANNIEVVTKQYVYRLRPKRDNWSLLALAIFIKKLKDDYDKAQASTMDEYYQRVVSGEDADYVWAEQSHKIMEMLAEKYDWNYLRVKR